MAKKAKKKEKEKETAAAAIVSRYDIDKKRLEELPGLISDIEEQMLSPNVPVREFVELEDKRKELYIEIENLEKKMKSYNKNGMHYGAGSRGH